jgi:hypothetical protein
MKKTTAFLSGLFLSSTLLWDGTTAKADDLVVRTPLEISGYCHMQFAPMRQDTLSWIQPVLDESAGNVIDFYGPCDHDPTGVEERKIQRRQGFRGTYGDND